MIAMISFMMSLTVIHIPLTLTVDGLQDKTQPKPAINPPSAKMATTNTHHQYYFQTAETQIQKVEQERKKIQRQKEKERQARLERERRERKRERRRQERLRRQRELARRRQARRARRLQQQRQAQNASGGEIVGYIKHYCGVYGCSSQKLIQVMQCESGGRVRASNGTHHGIFQFAPSTFQANAQRVGVSNPNIWSPKQQSRVAAWMFANGQAWQWTCA